MNRPDHLESNKYLDMYIEKFGTMDSGIDYNYDWSFVELLQTFADYTYEPGDTWIRFGIYQNHGIKVQFNNINTGTQKIIKSFAKQLSAKISSSRMFQ
jgi:hypothetical protein